MEQLVELLKQIQDLAGVAIDALSGGEKKQGPEGSPQEERSEPPAEAQREGDQQPPRG